MIFHGRTHERIKDPKINQFVLAIGSIHAKTTNRGRGHVADFIKIWTVY